MGRSFLARRSCERLCRDAANFRRKTCGMKPESPRGPRGLHANLDQVTFHISYLEIVRTLAVLMNLTDTYYARGEKLSSLLGAGAVESGPEFFGGARARPETNCAVILVEAE